MPWIVQPREHAAIVVRHIIKVDCNPGCNAKGGAGALDRPQQVLIGVLIRGHLNTHMSYLVRLSACACDPVMPHDILASPDRVHLAAHNHQCTNLDPDSHIVGCAESCFGKQKCRKSKEPLLVAVCAS